MSFQLLSHLMLLLLVSTESSFVMAQSCFREDIPFANLGGDSEHFPSFTQAIVTSYQFQCCGDITAWKTYVTPFGPNHRDGVYSIGFQVWRPSESVATDGCYSEVGEDVYMNIQLLDGEDGLVNRTLDPSSFISVQPGDVIGYFTILTPDIEGGIQHDPDFDTESVWYHTSTDDNPLMSRGGLGSCPFPVGDDPDRVLTTFSSLGPVLSVDIASYPCLTTEAEKTTADNMQPPTTAETFTPGDTAGSSTPITAGSTTPITAGSTTAITAGSTTAITAGSTTPITAESTTAITPGSTTSITAGSTTAITPESSTPIIAGVSSFAVLVVLLILLIACALCIIIIRRRAKKPSNNIPMATNTVTEITAADTEETYATISDHSHNTELSTTDIPTVTNECYSTSRLSPPTRPRVHQQQDMQLTLNQDVPTADDIPTVTNECYSASRLPPPTHPRVHQQQDMQLTHNQAYVTSANIPMEANKCYGTNLASVEEERYTSQRLTSDDYDYVIP